MSRFPFTKKQLRRKFPDKALPDPPRKHYFRRGTHPAVIEERKEALQKYLDALRGLDWVMSSDLFMDWLSISNTVILRKRGGEKK